MAVIICNSFEHESLFTVEVPTHPMEVEDSLQLVPVQMCRHQLALTRRTEVPASVHPNERTYGRYSPSFSLFLRLLDEPTIKTFLWMDSCAILADKYLLAMVYIYFRRARLQSNEYTALNFFLALYLANDMEEDKEDEKYEIFPWAIGEAWRSCFTKFLHLRDQFWQRMNYRSFVNRSECEEVFNLCSNHQLWSRTRQPHHGGAKRCYDDHPVRYERTAPTFCEQCHLSWTHPSSGCSRGNPEL